LTIIPIFRRELIAAARQGKRRLQDERRGFAMPLFVLVVGTFAAWYCWSGGELTSGTMGRISDEILRWGVAFHGGLFALVMLRGAVSIAGQRERRTLDLLLITRLASAEIVLGELAACVVMCLATMSAGVPIMLLLHGLGGVELWLLLLAYAGFASSILLLSAMAVWMSVELPDRRAAGGLFLLAAMAWLIGPFTLSVFLPRWGVRMPDWLAAANWQLVGSSPVRVIVPIATGLRSWTQLVREVAQMVGLQLAGTALFTAAAIARLRPAHRALAGVDREARRRERRRLVWRLRARPAVGDDPILWREKYTSRVHGLLKAANVLIFGGLLVGLAGATLYFARPAFVELWHHGYGSGSTMAPGVETNIFLRVFMPPTGPGGPPDLARNAFNIFIRFATVVVLMLVSFIIGGMAAEVLGVERLKDTWTSLLATPLAARDILRAAIISAVWRSRWAFGAVLVLWTLGLASGSIHPLGFVVALLEVAASVWWIAAFGVLGAIPAEKAETAAAQGVFLTLFLTCTGVLPFVLPAGFNSVLLGAGSMPLMAWTSLMSYRDLGRAMASSLAAIEWTGLPGGHVPLLVFACWLIVIVGPTLGGVWAWRYAVAHFDRLVGRPHRPAGSARPDAPSRGPAPAFPQLAAPRPGRRSPLAEADGRV
jgi:hypothetical protein